MNRALIIFSLAVGLAASTSFAQPGRMGGGPPGGGLGTQFAKYFGNNKEFSAKAECTVLAKERPEPITMEMEYAFLNGKLRTDIDMSAIKGGNIPHGAAAQMKQMGMDKMATLFLPEQKISLLIYPSLSA